MYLAAIPVGVLRYRALARAHGDAGADPLDDLNAEVKPAVVPAAHEPVPEDAKPTSQGSRKSSGKNAS